MIAVATDAMAMDAASVTHIHTDRHGWHHGNGITVVGCIVTALSRATIGAESSIFGYRRRTAGIAHFTCFHHDEWMANYWNINE